VIRLLQFKAAEVSTVRLSKHVAAPPESSIALNARLDDHIFAMASQLKAASN